jgi:DNA replication and repair protein RecF
MYIKNLSLKSFRNYEKLNIELSPNLNILYGDNAQGKTNILEAIYIAAIGRSQKAQKDSQIIKMNENEAHIQVFAVKDHLQNRIDVHLKKDTKKGIAVNGIPIKK